jgi:hypothetical protein
VPMRQTGATDPKPPRASPQLYTKAGVEITSRVGTRSKWRARRDYSALSRLAPSGSHSGRSNGLPPFVEPACCRSGVRIDAFGSGRREASIDTLKMARPEGLLGALAPRPSGVALAGDRHRRCAPLSSNHLLSVGGSN